MVSTAANMLFKNSPKSPKEGLEQYLLEIKFPCMEVTSAQETEGDRELVL